MSEVKEQDHVEAFKGKNLFSYPQFNNALKQLEFNCQMAPYCKRLTFILGESGTGKSAVMDTFVDKMNQGHEFPQAVKLKLNSPGGIGPLLKQIAKPIINLKSKTIVDDIRNELYQGIDAQQIKFIGIDEINSALPARQSNDKVMKIADTLKHLSDNTGATIGLFGTNESANLYSEAEFKKLSHGQLETRTNAFIRLTHFPADDSWVELMKYMLRNIAAPHELTLSSELLVRTHIATKGNFRIINDMFIYAHGLVQFGKHKKIDFNTLAEAFNSIASQTKANPYLESYEYLEGQMPCDSLDIFEMVVS